MADTRFCTHPYRYADGCRYRPNLFIIKVWDEEHNAPAARGVGGVIECKGKWFAYAGSVIHLQDKIERIMRCADAYAWGATKLEAVTKIKPHLATN